MTYELAKQLKDAGFKQGSGFSTRYIQDDEQVLICSGGDDHCACPVCYGYEEGFVAVPTLPELIEACGNNFGSLHSLGNNKWAAEVFSYRVGTASHEDGVTPEEAVAKLWLRLNKK